MHLRILIRISDVDSQIYILQAENGDLSDASAYVKNLTEPQPPHPHTPTHAHSEAIKVQDTTH